jgi:deazaflavin-dependent oxidoreductase (nitroreductase family)
MGTHNRDKMVKPDFMTDEQFQWLKDASASLDRIHNDAKADVESYLANPDGRASGKASPSGLPTLLLTVIGRKSGEKRTTPLVFLQKGESMLVVGSLGGYDEHPAWYLNLAVNPNCWVQLDRRRMTAVARDATGAERQVCWPELERMFPAWGYFQKQTDRPFPIVFLTPTGSA